MNNLQKKVYDLIRDDISATKASKAFDTGIVVLIIINVVLIILDTFNMPAQYFAVSNIIETISVIIFTAEYLLRVWTAPLARPEMRAGKARVKYIFSFMALIDLLAVLPFYIAFLPVDLRILRALRIIRLLRIFKVNRYTTALSTIAKVFKKKSHQLISSFIVCGLLMIIASVLMVNVEKEAQPENFSNAFTGLWWAMATLTTVGYGDVYPITVAGKILSAIIAVLGIGIVAVPTGIISAGFVEVCGEDEDGTQSLADEIKKCKELLDEGSITEAEYSRMKAKYLE